jgi:hypothetical protein
MVMMGAQKKVSRSRSFLPYFAIAHQDTHPHRAKQTSGVSESSVREGCGPVTYAFLCSRSISTENAATAEQWRLTTAAAVLLKI